MQVDSKPEELDELDRRIIQLKIERESAAERNRRGLEGQAGEALKIDLASLEEKADQLTATWQSEKQKLGLAADLKKQLDDARNALAIAQRNGEFQKAGELAYGEIPDLERKLEEAEESSSNGTAMVEETVTPDHIAHIVSRWTGIPVDKMLEGEKGKTAAHGRRAVEAGRRTG